VLAFLGGQLGEALAELWQGTLNRVLVPLCSSRSRVA
jgi:hypothetical protein